MNFENHQLLHNANRFFIYSNSYEKWNGLVYQVMIFIFSVKNTRNNVMKLRILYKDDEIMIKINN